VTADTNENEETKSQFKAIESRGRETKKMDRQASLRGRPLTPATVERNTNLAKNRRRDCSQLKQRKSPERNI
jgi:hypothetical protein